MTQAEQNREREIAHAIRIAREHASEHARRSGDQGGDFDVAEAIAILIDYVSAREERAAHRAKFPSSCVLDGNPNGEPEPCRECDECRHWGAML